MPTPSKEYMRKYYLKNKKKIAERNIRFRKTDAGIQMRKGEHLKSTYGLTKDEYNKILSQQNGVCAICLKAETCISKNGNPHRLAVDHDHSTGKVRGLLCKNCNTGLGMFFDSADLLRMAENYLRNKR
jgi:hypothetical protein